MKKTMTGALVGLCALAGCVEPPTPSNYAGEYEAALCAWSSGCSAFSSPAQCRDALVWDTIGRFQYLADAVEAGRMEFDADAAQACLETIAALPCEGNLIEQILFFQGPSAAPEPCQDVFVGKVRNYDPCMNSEECEGDNAVCGFSPTCQDACCVGACRDLGDPPAIGEACTGSCAEGAYCAFDPMSGAQTCAKRRPAGQSCADDSSACEGGLFCDFNGDPVCRKLLAAGASCEGDWQCADDLRCYNAIEGARTCRTLPVEGDACSNNNYPACARVDNVCDPSNRCVRLPAPGEPCPDYQCVPYADCRQRAADLVCVARPGLGGGCGPEADYVSCLGHLQCNDGSQCVEPEPEPVCDVPK